MQHAAIRNAASTPSQRHTGAWLAILMVACAWALCTWQLFFCEYKSDQVASIEHGARTFEQRFLITHGMASGAKFNNPPTFLWLMALLTRLSMDPFVLTCFFYLIHCLTLVLAARFVWVALPRATSLWAIAFLAFWPSSAMYSNIILPQSLLPPLLIGFHWQMYLFAASKRSAHFALACLCAAMTSLFHLSGLLLYPLLLILGCRHRKHLKITHLLLVLAAMLLLWAPFLYHLFAEKHLEQVLTIAGNIKKVHWKIFREHLRFSSFDYFRFYFSMQEFNPILRKIAGPLWVPLYGASCLLMALFPAGLLWYLYKVLRARKAFIEKEFFSCGFPYAVQLAGFLIVGLTVGYLVAHAPCPPHYLLVMFPSHIILCAHMAGKASRYTPARLLLIVSLLATALLLAGTLRFFKRSGGHPQEYYLNYALVQKIRHEAWQLLPPDSQPVVSVVPDNYTYQLVLSREIARGWKFPEGTHKVPVRIELRWDASRLQYRYRIWREE